MIFAYADPPYIGQAKKHYAKEAAAAGRVAEEVNYPLLIAHLNEFDAFALSASSPSLEELLHICREVLGPNQVRVGSWVKPFAVFKPNVNPAYAWEPVIFKGARKRDRTEPTVRDWHSANITLKKGVSGAKPESFSLWLFDLIGLLPEDEFVDLFPGSNAVSIAYEKWKVAA